MLKKINKHPQISAKLTELKNRFCTKDNKSKNEFKKNKIMAYSLYHIISTTVMENVSVLDCLEGFIKGEKTFTELELLEMIANAKGLNKKLNECSTKVIIDINKEIF